MTFCGDGYKRYWPLVKRQHAVRKHSVIVFFYVAVMSLVKLDRPPDSLH